MEQYGLLFCAPNQNFQGKATSKLRERFFKKTMIPLLAEAGPFT
jgi:hypothetical protein